VIVIEKIKQAEIRPNCICLMLLDIGSFTGIIASLMP
jgi:hypothetical protein